MVLEIIGGSDLVRPHSYSISDLENSLYQFSLRPCERRALYLLLSGSASHPDDMKQHSSPGRVSAKMIFCVMLMGTDLDIPKPIPVSELTAEEMNVRMYYDYRFDAYIIRKDFVPPPNSWADDLS